MRRKRRGANPILESLEPRIALAASVTSGLNGLVHLAVETHAVQQKPSPGLLKIERLAEAAYVRGLPAESVYRFSKYNELVTSRVNTLAYGQTPASWNSPSTNAGNASVLYINGELDLTRQNLVYTIPATNADFQVTQIIQLDHVASDPGTRHRAVGFGDVIPARGAELAVFPSQIVTLRGFTYM